MKQFFLTALLLVAACKDNRPPAPSQQQSAQLNEADAMLEAMAQNEEGPEANAPSPSNRTK